MSVTYWSHHGLLVVPCHVVLRMASYAKCWLPVIMANKQALTWTSCKQAVCYKRVCKLIICLAKDCSNQQSGITTLCISVSIMHLQCSLLRPIEPPLLFLLVLQARRQISSLLQEGKASVQQGEPMHALELLKQVRTCVSSTDHMSEQA